TAGDDLAQIALSKRIERAHLPHHLACDECLRHIESEDQAPPMPSSCVWQRIATSTSCNWPEGMFKAFASLSNVCTSHGPVTPFKIRHSKATRTIAISPTDRH